MSAILPFLVVLLAVAFFTRMDFFFYLLYALAGIYILGRIWARRSLAAVDLERRHDQRVFWGETFPVQVEVQNRSWLPVLWLRLHDTVPAGLMPGTVFRRVISLLPRERLQLEYTMVGRRRGYYAIGPLVTLGGDLLGAASYEHRFQSDDFVIVYPKIIALRDLGFPSQSPFGTLPSRERLFEDPTRIRGVRDYQPGDSLRRMDWKTSARVGSLQVRRFEPAIALETAVFLNLNGAEYPQAHRRQATELGIIAAASVAVHLVEKRQAVGLITNGRDPLADASNTTPSLPLRKGREHLMHLLDLLACIEVASEDESVPFLDLLSRKSLGLPWGSTVVVITAQEVKGLLDTLLAFRRRGLVVILALTCPDRAFDLTVQRADQIGIRALRLWIEQDMDVWR
jgi:uncharacterized protein (DUF58 family)